MAFDKSFLSTNVTGSNDSDTDRLPPGAVSNASLLDLLFEQAMTANPYNEFLADVYDFYERKGFITEKQYAVLERYAKTDA